MTPPSKRPVRRIPAADDSPRKAPPRNLNEDGDPEDDDDEDEAPRKPAKKAAAKSADNGLRGGYTAAQQMVDSTSDFAQTLKLEEKAVVIKFLEDTPYVNFRRHWIERSTKEGKSLRAWTCLKSVDKDCPLCEVGDKAQAVVAYNVALIGDDGQVLLKTWDLGPRLFNVVKGYNNDPRVGPLTKGYFLVSKTGKRGTVQHNVAPVSRTALSEDYDIEPPSRDQLEAIGLYDTSVVTIPRTKDLQELAEEISDEYD